MREGLIDRIYEAAFVPDLWSDLLIDIARTAGAATGSLLVFEGPAEPPRYRTTALLEEMLAVYTASDAWKASRRAPSQVAWPPEVFSQFLLTTSQIAPEALDQDSDQAILRALGLEWQIGTLVSTMRGQVTAFIFDRLLASGPYRPDEVAALDAVRPHLARAAMVAARLRLERAQGVTALMAGLGLPAAVMSADRRVLATNALLERMPEVFVPLAHGGLALAHAEADTLLRQALAELSRLGHSAVRSIPIPVTEEHGAIVVHVLPLRRSARDVFAGSDVLVAATELKLGEDGPPVNLLMGLYDLTGSEARIATALAAGRTLQEASDAMGIKVTTARAYLAQIFRKTGTHQQSQLVALLAGARPPIGV